MKRKMFGKALMFIILICFSFAAIPTESYGEAGKSDATELTQKISTEGLSPFNSWWVEMYNDERLVYALCVTGVMAVLGITIGFGTDIILRVFGFKTAKIVHHE